MSAAIGSELHHVLNCLWYGVVLFMVYDALRIFREMIRHAAWVIGLEDLLFWIWAAFYLFSRFFVDTYGTVRGYQLLMTGIGGIIWEYGCGKFLTKKMIFCIRWLKFRVRRCKILMYMHNWKLCLGVKQREKRKRMQENNQKRNQKNSQGRQGRSGAAKRKKHARARKHAMQNKFAIQSITIVVCLLLVTLFLHGRSLQEKVRENEVRLTQLQEAYDREQARTQEIEDLQEYMQSDEFIEQYAKEKIGLLKENEILFKENK